MPFRLPGGVFRLSTPPNIFSGFFTGLSEADLFDLGFSGGSTPVHRLCPTSAALDAGNGTAPNDALIFACRETDQRGNPRPNDGGGSSDAVCDIGAVEM